MKKIVAFAIIAVIITSAAFFFFKDQKNQTKQQANNPATQAKIIAQIANTQLSVDSDGNLVAAPFKDLVQLFLPQEASPQAGQKLEDATSVFVIKLAALLSKSDFHATSIRIITADNILAYDQKDTIAVFSAQKDAEVQVNTLQQVLAEARIGDDKIAKIDLRFANPVISNK